MTSLFWISVLVFAVVAIGLSWDWYRTYRREKVEQAALNGYRNRREAVNSTAHLTQSFEAKAAKGFARAPRIVPKADRRQGPKIH